MRFVHTVVATAFIGVSLCSMAQAHHHNNAGAFVGGLVAGAVIGGAAVAASQPRPYYYPPYPVDAIARNPCAFISSLE